MRGASICAGGFRKAKSSGWRRCRRIAGRGRDVHETKWRPGFSTCSLEPEENERVVEHFLAKHPRFTAETTRALFPPPLTGWMERFVAKFLKTNAA